MLWGRQVKRSATEVLGFDAAGVPIPRRGPRLKIHAFAANFPVAIARGLRLTAAADLAFRFLGGRGRRWFLGRQ